MKGKTTQVKTKVLPTVAINAILVALLGVSAVMAVLVTTTQFTVTLVEPLSLSSWSPALPMTSYPGVILNHTATLTNAAPSQYNVLYRLNVTADLGVQGVTRLFINNVERLTVYYDGNTTVKQVTVPINPSSSHQILLQIHTDGGSIANRTLATRMDVERLAAP
ncbi:MAG: hypothetical protein QXD61_06270 [Candidatus Caldarchaeum sp.]